MIHEHEGNLLHVQKGIIVHGCNARGVMGSGVAFDVRQIWPKAYACYRREYERAGLKLGDVIFYKPRDHLLIANAITQEDYGRDLSRVYVDYEAVRQCFEKVLVVARWLELPVHFPLIGCGLANGDWEIISEIIDKTIPDEFGKHLWVLPKAKPVHGDQRIAA